MGYYYYSVRTSNYLTLFRVLINNRISFEYHSKTRGAGMAYADFCLDSEHDPTYSDIERMAESIERERGKFFTMEIITEYEA